MVPGLIRLIPLLLVVVVLAVFGPSCGADFVAWDDNINVYGNQHVQGFSAANLAWMFTDLQQAMRYKPLSWLSWCLVHEGCGLRPAAYHALNLIFHSANTVVVFLLLRRLARLGWAKPADVVATNRLDICCALGTLLWSLHPLRVEPVAWVSGLSYTQSAFFVLLAVWAYLRYVGRVQSRPAHRESYWLSVLAFGASLLTYPLALAGPVVFVILDFYPLRRLRWGSLTEREARLVWLEKIPFVLLAEIICGLTWWSRLHGAGLWQPPTSLDQFGVASRMMQAFYMWAVFLWKTLMPVNLSPVYTVLESVDPQAPVFLGSLLAILAISALAFLQRGRWPAFAAVWLCHLVVMVPVLGLTEHPHFPSDRYSYLVSVGWSVLIMIGLWYAVQMVRRGRVALVVAALAAVACAGLSSRQTLVWTNSETLFTHMISQLGDCPRRADTCYLLGRYYLRAGRPAEAEVSLSEARRILPDSPQIRLSLNEALSAQGKLPLAGSAGASPESDHPPAQTPCDLGLKP